MYAAPRSAAGVLTPVNAAVALRAAAVRIGVDSRGAPAGGTARLKEDGKGDGNVGASSACGRSQHEASN